MTRLWVPGPLPAQNEIISKAKGFGGRGIGYSRMKADWTSTIAWIIRAAHVPKMKRVRCEFTWVSANRKHDPDNIEAAQKFIWDALVIAGVLENDGWAQNAGSSHRHVLGPAAGVFVDVIDASAESQESQCKHRHQEAHHG